MIKINSEIPLCLLNENNKLNEYDFVLFHLYKTNKKYREYFLNQRKENPDRLMIFDNSAYEFFVKNETLDMGEFYKAILELNPDYYILPDTLMNMAKTLIDTKSFLNVYGVSIRNDENIKSEPLAVVQGNSVAEMQFCVSEYKKLKINAVALPFHNSFYRNMDVDVDIMDDFFSEFGPDNVDAEYAMGRVQLMRNWKGWLKDSFKHIHLLGSHQPYEKKYYHDFDTMDTGYPVKCALEGVMLGNDYKKPDTIIDDFLEKDLEDGVKERIKINIRAFKHM